MTDSTDPTSETADTNSQSTTTECDKCEHLVSDTYRVDIDSTQYHVCEGCRDTLRGNIENHFWYDSLTEEHYDKASAYLRSLDEVWCVKDHAYPLADLWVHTPYCDAAIVRDVCEHFHFKIRWFSVVSPADDCGFDCVEEHGPCIEVHLVPQNSPRPLPLEAEVAKVYSEIEWMDKSSKLF